MTYFNNFHQWSEEDFKAPTNNLLRKLRVLLRKRGVWVSKNPTIAKSLVDLLAEETPTQWTEEEIINEDEDFVSSKIKKLLRTDFGRNPYSPASSAQSRPQLTQRPQGFSTPSAQLRFNPQPSNPLENIYRPEQAERRPFEAIQPPLSQQSPNHHLYAKRM